MSFLNARDPENAAAFYGAVFGWETQPFHFGDTEGALFRLPGFVGGEPEQSVPRDVVAAMVPLETGYADESPESHWGASSGSPTPMRLPPRPGTGGAA